jgi:hypothetical protein
MGQCFGSEQQISISREETTTDTTKQQKRQKEEEQEQEQQKAQRRQEKKSSTTIRSILKKTAEKDVENLVSKFVFVNYIQIRYTIIRVCLGAVW